MSRIAPLLPIAIATLALTACSDRSPYATSIGTLPSGARLTVRIAQGDVTAYAPASGEPFDRFTVAATARADRPQPAPPSIRPAGKGITVSAGALDTLLVRVPRGVNLTVESLAGDVSATGIDGNADVRAVDGNVRLMLNGHGQTAVGKGNSNVTMGATAWPGTLHFSAREGDVLLYVNENAPFRMRLHTGNGVLFTDFAVRGTSQGTSETIDAPVNGGGRSGIDVEVGRGSIRVLKLHPQA